MPICPGGGASQRKPGANRNLLLTTAGIAALLNNVPVAWAVPFAVGLAAVSYDLDNMCATDPPAMPNITTADAIALSSGWADPIGFATAAAKIYDLVKLYLWYEMCECAAATTPAAPAPPAPPANLPVINPPGIGVLPTQPCFSGSFDGQITVPFNTGEQNISDTTLPKLGRTISGASLPGCFPDTAYVLPAPLPVQIRVVTTTSGGGAGEAVTGYLEYFNDAGAQIGQQQVANIGAGGTNDVTRTTLAGATFARLAYAAFPNGATIAAHVTTTVICQGQTTGGIATPCCPPDPILTGLLQQILGLVTITQRQIAPFAYVPGPAHPGLTGALFVNIASPIIGVEVVLTTVPDYIASVGNFPTHLFDAGFVSVGDGDGWFSKRRLTTTRTVWFPDAAGAATMIGFDLPPGVVATITELRREP